MATRFTAVQVMSMQHSAQCKGDEDCICALYSLKLAAAQFENYAPGFTIVLRALPGPQLEVEA